MLGHYFHFLKITLLLLGAGGLLSAGDFVTPAEGPVAFRRDRVPVDAETMIKLSAQLTILSDALEAETPAQRRAAAQMLALAIALDPVNTRARTVIEKFEMGQHRPDASPEKISKIQDSLRDTLGWLETAEAAADGQALASCLMDALAVADPDNPRTEAMRAAGERGKWAGWVADTAAFEMTKIPAAPAPNTGEIASPQSKSGVLLAEATIFLPLWQKVPDSDPVKWRIVSASLKMKAGPNEPEDAEDDEDRPFSIAIGRPIDGEDGVTYPFAALIPVIQKLLVKQHGELPMNYGVWIDSSALDESLEAKKRQSVSAAAAVLASAALSGREPDATIVGQIDSMGAFKLPTGFWDQLRVLMFEKGKRLILPAAAEPYLQSVLAVEYPQFFLNNEVLLASNFTELLELSAKTPSPEIGKISAQFQEIRAKVGTQPVSQYVANSFVRRRLVEISQTASYHASAKMLAIQGAGNRPVTLIRPVLISELRLAIEPMEWIFDREDSFFGVTEFAQIGTTYETCAAELKRIERYVEKSDRELLGRVEEMVALLRSLDRATRARPDPDDWSTTQALQSSYYELKKAHRDIVSDLTDTSTNVTLPPSR